LCLLWRKFRERLKNGVKNSDWKKYLAAARIEDFNWHDSILGAEVAPKVTLAKQALA
jgi:hypothetical protein